MIAVVLLMVADLATLALLNARAGMAGELNPVVVGIYAATGFAGLVALKGVALSLLALVAWLDSRVGRWTARLAVVPLAVGVAVNAASLVALP